jgi:hypothetical protein
MPFFLARCENVKCDGMDGFHVIPKNDDDKAELEKLMNDAALRTRAWLDIICPCCGKMTRRMASSLENCECSYPLHYTRNK